MKALRWRTMLILGYLLPIAVQGQQQPMYTQYMFNPLAINPAYAGTSDALSITALSRWQWVGMEGAPVTQTLSVQAPVQSRKVGLGLTVTVDEIAVTKQTGVYGAFAYRIPVGSGYLSFGLQAGFTALKADYDKAYVLGTDPVFQQQYSEFMPNAGGGLFYYNSLFYAGLSSPMLIQNKVESGGSYVFTQRRHYFFNTGMVFRLSDEIKAKPNLLVKTVEGSPVSIDYNVNFLFKNVAGFGVSYRGPESVNFLTEININKRFRFGYAYDHVIQPTLKNAATSSHEILLNYRVSLTKNGVLTPRQF
jgi:type IX secretion system PorP/SprF family membrane protein